jgi:hypothetical protein
MFNQEQLKQVDSTPDNKANQDIPVTKNQTDQTTSAKSSLENTDIYYMPENFQKNNQVAGHNMNISGIVVLVLGIIFLIILAGGLYIYLVKPDFISNFLGRSNTPVVVTENQIPTSTITPVVSPIQPTRPAGSPKDTYLAFRSELELADTVDKYLAVFARYGTKDKQDKLASQKANLESIGGQGDILTALRGTPVPALDGTENITEDITDERAILTVSKTSGKSIGTVTFLPEDNQWKISEEVWTEATGSNENNNTAAIVGIDDDQDGLTNLEEALLGTNAKASDSDGDGFKDAEELNNSYNPAGAGKISANTGLGTYQNSTFNFSLLYPVKWDRTIAATDDSVIFTAANHQFVQILVQPNSDQEDIVSWYRKTFNVQTIPNSQLVINASWDGVKTPDGLTVYLTNKDKTYIFVLTYNLGTINVLEYKNIFDMMVRSLKLGV